MQHCDDVMKEADQAKKLKNYVKSISLYFSIPKNSPCFEDSKNDVMRVYNDYIKDKCQKQIALLDSYAILSQKEGENREKYYDMIIDIINDISPEAELCYDAAVAAMKKIEKNLSEKQKQDWELRKINASDEKEIEKERFKAIQKINQNYVPPSVILIGK